MADKSSKSANLSTENFDSPQDFGNRFRTFRDKNGLTQTQLAALLDAHPNYISQIERGEKEPGKRLLKDFATLEESPAYGSEVSSTDQRQMAPPHVQEAPRFHSSPSISKIDPSLSHTDYVQAVSMLGTLFDQHPAAFRTVLAMIKGVHDQEVKG